MLETGKKHIRISYDISKHNDTKERGDPVTIVSLKKLEVAFNKPMHKGFAKYEEPVFLCIIGIFY